MARMGEMVLAIFSQTLVLIGLTVSDKNEF